MLSTTELRGILMWLDFERHSLAFFGDEACHEHHRQLAAGPYCLTAPEARAPRIVRRRLRKLLTASWGCTSLAGRP